MDEPSDTGRAGISPDRLGQVATGLLCTVVVGAGVYASARHWMPTGDDAFLSLRTRHLVGRHPILLNNASSGGPSAGKQYNHPGAFPLALLAPFTLLFGPNGIALGTAVVNAAWMGSISVMVRRIAGPTGRLVAVVTMALLACSMSATFLVDPWNPNYAIWPLAALVVATWGVQRGSFRMLPVAVLASSVAFQTHLSVTVPAAALAVWAVGGTAFAWWRARRDDPAVARHALRWTGVGAIVGVVANAQMLADQFSGTGNLGKILEGTGFKEAPVTVRQIGGVLVTKWAFVPGWFRGGWSRPVFLTDLPGTPTIVLGVVAACVVTAGAVLVAHQRARVLASLFAVLAVALVPACGTATRFPLRIGIPLPYFRWVWPLAAIWAAAVVSAFVAAARPERWPHRILTAAGAVIVVASLVGAAIPGNREVDPNPEWAQDLARPFASAAVAATRDKGPILVEQNIGESALWVIPALMDQLDAAGIDVRATDRVLVQQTSDRYRAGGDERWRLVLKGGLQIDDAPEGGRLLARHDELTTTERRELERLVDRLSPALEEPGSVRLTSTGRAETDAADLEHLTTGELAPSELLRSVPFRLALERGAVTVAGVDRADLMRATVLGARDGGRSVALYLAPTART